MAFVTDPDDLTRNQVVYNTYQKLAYAKGVNATAKESGTNGRFDADYPSAGTHTLTSAGKDFGVAGVVIGDILVMATDSQNAGHWRVTTVGTTTLEVQPLAGDVSTPVDEAATDRNYSVRLPTGGTVEPSGATLFADLGVSLQALYSFSKEEWKDDAALIPVQFPFELITREQGEVGGGADNSDWKLGNDVTKQLIRSGGWANKNAAGTMLQEFAGIITLGALDSDAQAYYLQVAAGTPVNFVRRGPVNQPIRTDQYPTFLKLFARKKARSYVGSAIADIGVSTIETIVNRFPLAHATDPSIVLEDGNMAGDGTATGDIFQKVATKSSGSDGTSTDPDTTDGLFTFTASTGTPFAGVKARDTLEITSGPAADQGVYEIQAVTSDTVVICFLEPGQTLTGGSGLSFTCRTRIRSLEKANGALANVDGATGTITSAGATFVTDGVTAGDMVQITADAAAHIGVYKIISCTETVLTCNTSDKAFTTQSNQTFTVFRPGMHLQYKKEALGTLTSTEYGTLEFTAPDLITRTTGSWISDGYNVAGRSVVTSGAATAANNGTFTIESATATVLTIVEQTLVNEVASTTETVNGSIPFIRDVSGPDYGFNWRLFANGATLAQAFQWLQRQLRRSTDIDESNGTARGDITDLLMSFASPTGKTLNLFPDDISSGELNNLTMQDATVRDRSFAFIVGVKVNLSQTLLDDPTTNRIVVFFTDLPGDLDYGKPGAVIVDDKDGADMNFSNQSSTPISTTFDYDNNEQGGRTKGTEAPVTVVGIGKSNAQFVLATGTITKVNEFSISLVSALERNYAT